MYDNLYLSAVLIVATCCTLNMVFLCWRRRSLPIAITYGLGMLSGAFYTFGYAFEIVSSSLEQIRFWLRVEYIGIPFGAALWMILILQYTGRQELLRKRVVALLLAVPVTTLVAHFTNESHHLFYQSMSLDNSAGFPLIVMERGPLYWLHLTYAYALFVIGMVLLIRMYRQAMPRTRKQVALMMLGSCGPYGGTLLYLSGITGVPIDYTPFGFFCSGVCYLWGIYQFNLLRLAPFAWQKAFESMKEAVVVLDLEYGVVSFNKSASQALEGLSRKNVIGQSALPILSSYPQLLEWVIRHESISADKMRLTDEPDSRFYRVYISPIYDYRNKPVGKMLKLSDVTESVRNEDALLSKSNQLAELNTFKDKMFNVVAHDIRDPLAVLVNLMELLEEEMQACGGGHEEIVHEMGRQVQNTFALVEGLLEWFKSQRGGMVFNPEIRDLSQAIQANVQGMEVRSASKGIRIQSDISTGLMVYADKEMLDLVLRNILSNAIKFTHAGGVIRVKAECANGQVIVSVRDSGAGMPTNLAQSLLHDSYPLSSIGTAGERGVGLGLTLCKEFVRLNGGDIWFESELDRGSTFYFSVPASPETASISTVNRMEAVS